MELKELGIISAKEKQFLQKGIDSVEKLIHFFPRKYIDCTKDTDLADGEFCVREVEVLTVEQHEGKVATMILARCKDCSSGSRISVMWFRQDYLLQSIQDNIGSIVLLAGKFSYDTSFGNYSVSSPFLFTSDVNYARRIYSVYSKIPGMSDSYLSDKMTRALAADCAKYEILPPDVIVANKLISAEETIKRLHYPERFEDLQDAHRRLIFNDLLYFSINIEKTKAVAEEQSAYVMHRFTNTKPIIEALPFSLTDDQRAVLRSMANRTRECKKIRALVQGDVGSGKSIVAYLMMTSMADNGFQSVIMAPTQVLAQQHYEEIKKLTEPYGLKTVLLQSGMKKKEKEAAKKLISSGEASFVVGTHSLISPEIEFFDLGLIVVDEEHKFGVVQRNAISERVSKGVHYITMSATPIPRSLAETIYGCGTQVHTIKTLPGGRKPIETFHEKDVEQVFDFLVNQVRNGRQAYVVCPMIDKNEDFEGVLSIEELEDIYTQRLAPLGIKVATLTGRNTKEEVTKVIGAFKNKDIDVLLSTTVIEVGVNVPNATTIIIHNAERFGLAGLHQLRGRVGRGSFQSYCILISKFENNPRIDAMCETTDGFKIAEKDLLTRGAGELIGLKQSGDDKFLSLMLTNQEIFDITKEVAKELISSHRADEVLNLYEKHFLAATPILRKEKRK